MRRRTKWFIAGGAAAFVLTPVAAVSGSTTLDADLPQHGLVIEAQAANTTEPSTIQPGTTQPSAEPSGKKTVSAPSPVSSASPASPVSPVGSASPVSPHTAVSPRTALSPQSPG